MHTDCHVDMTNGCAVIAIFMFFPLIAPPSGQDLRFFPVTSNLALISVLSLAKMSHSVQEL